MKMNPKKLFLVDGLGTLISSITLGVVLTSFQGYIGIPTIILWFLAVLAAVISTYSLSNFVFFERRNPSRMKLLWVSNVLYCLLTALLCLIYFSSVSKIGLTYFVAEIVLILCLVTFEKRAAKRMSMSG